MHTVLVAKEHHPSGDVHGEPQAHPEGDDGVAVVELWLVGLQICAQGALGQELVDEQLWGCTRSRRENAKNLRASECTHLVFN